MVDRWESRIEPEPGQGKLYWHILLAKYPDARTLASVAQKRLAPFAGLHFTPQQWLHITTLVVGFAESFSIEEIEKMKILAHDSICGITQVNITPGKILYHAEAIAIGLRPAKALDSIRNALRQASCEAVGDEKILDSEPWNPHFTIAYSTASQPAAPIIAALGKELPCREIAISSVSLVVQQGAERLWHWDPIEEIHLSKSSS
jgi:2'-5' RNA ligase